MMVRRKLVACCAPDIRQISLDFDEQERIMTYNGLERCILNSQSFDNDSGTSGGGLTDSYNDDDEDDSTCSSSNNACGSFSSFWTVMKKDDDLRRQEWPEKSPSCSTRFLDVETMKEKFSNLLLGGDVTGGAIGMSTALALSNAITSLAATVFGELWKLEPLPEERKWRWRTEMDWLVSPTNYMVELVPAKQHDTNGRVLEIMTPKARSDISMNLPALRKLDSMLTEMLDSMVGTEFWYAELGSRAEGRSQSRRWWLPSPRVPSVGLSDIERKRLLHQGKLVHQVFKAARSINENVLAEMPVPTSVKGALPKSGRACLGEEMYKILTAETVSGEDVICSLNLKSEHAALDAINRLEAAMHAWKCRIAEQSDDIESPARTPWRFVRDTMSHLDKVELLVNKAEVFLQQIKAKYPNLPHTFLDVTKIQFGRDIGHAILEAYSRVLANLAFSILARIGDILQEDVTSNPNSPLAMSRLVGNRIPGLSDSPMLDRVRHSLIQSIDLKS